MVQRKIAQSNAPCEAISAPKRSAHRGGRVPSALSRCDDKGPADVKNMSLTPEGGLTFTMDVATKPDLNPRIDVLLRVTARPWNRRTNRSS